MTKDRAALEFAAAHGGVVTAQRLSELGFTFHEIRGRVRRHNWKSIGRGSYRLIPVRDHRDSLLAAVTVLERAVISHESAAEIHGFTRIPLGLTVVSVHSRTTHDFPGVRAVRCHDLDESHVTSAGSVPVTTIERTVVDLAAGRSPGHVGAIVDDLVSRKLLDFPAMVEIVGSVARKGKPGMVTMREVINLRGGEMRPQSELERRARRLLESAGLPAPIPEFPIPWAPNRRFDDAYPGHKLAIEWDSRRYHGQLDAFEADRLRDREAAIHGWRIVRFTWRDVTERSYRVVDSIWQLLSIAS